MMRKVIYPLVFIFVSCTAANEGKIKEATDEPIIIPFAEFKMDTLAGASYPNFEIDRAYRYKGFQLLFGIYGLSEPVAKDETNYGLKLLVLDQSNRKVFESRGQADSYYFWPRFYRAGNESPIVIMAETGTEYSWGNQVFLMNDNSVKEIGDIPLAVEDKELENHHGISDVTKIKQQGRQIIFSFATDSVIFDPGGMNEKNMAAKGYSYIYDGKEFKKE